MSTHSKTPLCIGDLFKAMKTRESIARIDDLEVSVFKVPTDSPESDGTYEWDSTTLVVVHVSGGGRRGLGYTYADTATGRLIEDKLTAIVCGCDAMSIPGAYRSMLHSIRNLGRPGICSMAISAVDTSLWDLKAKLLELPLVRLFGQVRESMPIYGSGGFTSYSNDRLCKQLGGWIGSGISRVKMKIGRDPEADRQRVAAARQAIGKDAELFVDANGAYSKKQALAQAQLFQKYNVSWFEEPVSSDDLDGLHFVRQRAPSEMEIATGEYGYTPEYFQRMLDAGSVDVLQADATRCGGFTGFLEAAAICEARHVPLSAHCAPALHLHIGCATAPLRHAEYFHDHVRIEKMLFDGVIEPADGALRPDLSRLGIGLELKQGDAEKYRIK